VKKRERGRDRERCEKEGERKNEEREM